MRCSQNEPWFPLCTGIRIRSGQRQFFLFSPLRVSRGKMPSPFNKRDELHHMWPMAACSFRNQGNVDAIRPINLPHPCMGLVVVYAPSCLSESSPEADSWPAFCEAAILLKASTSAGAIASASAGAIASASAGASADTSKALSNGDACDMVRARSVITVLARATLTASSVRDAAFKLDPPVAISALITASNI